MSRHVGLVTINVLPDTQPLTTTTAAFLLHDQSLSVSTNDGRRGILPPNRSRFWQPAEEASRNVIKSLAQTGDGFLWIGTQGGLARFDGEEFEFVPLEFENRSFTYQPINALSPAGDGGLWIGTAGEGLLEWREGNCVQHEAPAKSDPNILAIQQLADGGLWLGTRKGLAFFRNGKVATREEQNDSAPGLENNSATRTTRSIAADGDGDLWIGAGGHLLRMRQGVVVTNLDLNAFNPTFIRSVCVAADGSI